MVDEPTAGASGEHDLKDDSLGGYAAEESEHQVPRDGGDLADATRDGGADADAPSRTGAGSVADTPGHVGDASTAEGEDANPSGREGLVERLRHDVPMAKIKIDDADGLRSATSSTRS